MDRAACPVGSFGYMEWLVSSRNVNKFNRKYNLCMNPQTTRNNYDIHYKMIHIIRNFKL